jgi:hypothetical protein
MLPKNGASFLTLAAVVNDHGGEERFWSQYLNGELSPAVQAWVRTQAETDAGARAWLAAVDGPNAQQVFGRALEAVNYLVDVEAEPAERPAGDDELTKLVQDSTSEVGLPAYRERVRECLFQLLDELEIRLPADSQARDATALVEVLVGTEPVRLFKETSDWLRGLRQRRSSLSRRDRVLVTLIPELLEKKHEHWRYQLSFRLFLRERFRHYAEQCGWQPVGPQFHDLDSAFDALTRQRIGDLARAAATDPDAGELRQGWELACVDFAD